MRTKRGSKSSLFLIELIIVLFFFMLVAAVCVQVFVKAHLQSSLARELSHAQSLTSSAAEVLSGTDGTLEAFEKAFPGGSQRDGQWIVPYNEDWEVCEPARAVYLLELAPETRDSIKKGRLALFKEETLITSLEVRFHLPLHPSRTRR